MAVIEDPMQIVPRTGTVYPAPFDKGFDGRLKRALTTPLGLTQFGVNVTTLQPGAMSALRHWHAKEDEFVYVLSGELTLVTDAGRTVLKPGMAAGFPAGAPDGHHLINESSAPATYLEVGTRSSIEHTVYPDVDMQARKADGIYRFLHMNGEPYT